MSYSKELRKMLETYDLVSFGNFLKKTRRSLNLTQADVFKLSGLTKDTLRRIEQGNVMPRFDTIIVLSSVYKMDLIKKMIRYSESSHLIQYYQLVDRLIISFDKDKIKTLEEDFIQLKSKFDIKAPIDYQSYAQLHLIIKGLSLYYSDNIDQSFACFIDALVKYNSDFTLETYQRHKYSVLEMRALLMISLCLSAQDDFIQANEILDFTLNQLDLNENSSLNELLLGIKTLLNLSYNFHRLSQHKQALDFSNKGIALCNKNYLTYGLANLIARKGVAEYYLGIKGHRTTLQQAVDLLKIEQKHELAKIYIEITQDKYGIQLQ